MTTTSLRSIHRQSVPAWYQLRVNLDPPVLIVAVHPLALDLLINLFSQDRVLPLLQERLGLGRFEPLSRPMPNLEWGIGSCAQIGVDVGTGWHPLLFHMPKPMSGKGVDWTKLFEITATLSRLFTLLSLFDLDTNSRIPQVSEITGMQVERGEGNSGFSAVVSPAFVKWVESHAADSRCDFAERAMAAFYKQLTGTSQEPDAFGALVRPPKAVNLKCPGDRCQLDPSDGSVYSSTTPNGYGLSGHNVDGPDQALTLLAGFFALSQEAERHSMLHR